MTYILKNKNIAIQIDAPFENYNFSRFDWTGKIVEVKFQDVQLTSKERTDSPNENNLGKGFYNEFGIDTALGFEETEIGGWFHKIGVGLLKKEDSHYLFNKTYKIKPAKFDVISEANRILISCISEDINGYSYLLKKEIELQENGFTIKYFLKNTGKKNIHTDEYVHNFTAINREFIGTNYILKFPFQLKPEFFNETVNPEQKVEISSKEIKFNDSPKQEFFFSNLCAGKLVTAEWELINLKSNIAIKETGNFQTAKINLWGWEHVISPELFFKIFIKPSESIEWSRNYSIYKI